MPTAPEDPVPTFREVALSVPPGVPAASRPIEWEPDWAAALLRWRYWLVAAWLLMNVLAFNGQWRIGPDTSVFRSVAHSLTSGEGYAVLREPQALVYPGLPFLLAAIERVFGQAVWPAIVLNLLMATITLWFTYRLVHRLLPEWAAVVATVGLGSNALFVQLSHELLTDVPFLLGVVMALWGWEALSDRGWKRKALAASALLFGLALTAVMRPTFWPLAGAFVLTSLAGLHAAIRRRAQPTRRRRWPLYAGVILLVALTALTIIALDPRTGSFLAGGYEMEVLDRLLSPAERLRQTPHLIWRMFEDNLEESFFALRVEGLNLVIAAGLLVGMVLVAPHRPLWGLLFLLLLAAMYVASSTARYYLMVMPILWVGWILLTTRLALRIFVSQTARSRFALAVIGVAVACNLGHNVKLIIEQRRVPFIESYAHGEYVPVYAMARLIAEVTEPHERIVGPYAREMTYLSGRHVLGQRKLLRAGGSREQLVDALLKAEPEWAIFPAAVYYRRERALYHLGRQGIFVPTNVDDSAIHSAGEFDGVEWYLTRQWAIDETMLPTDK